jgi:hypothetical protein
MNQMHPLGYHHRSSMAEGRKRANSWAQESEERKRAKSSLDNAKTRITGFISLASPMMTEDGAGMSVVVTPKPRYGNPSDDTSSFFPSTTGETISSVIDQQHEKHKNTALIDDDDDHGMIMDETEEVKFISSPMNMTQTQEGDTQLHSKAMAVLMRIRLHPNVVNNLSMASIAALKEAGLFEIEFG